LDTVAVLGNHDLWRGANDVIGALRRAGIRTLDNDAIARASIMKEESARDFVGRKNVIHSGREVYHGKGLLERSS
jgi:hypothetical protein